MTALDNMQNEATQQAITQLMDEIHQQPLRLRHLLDTWPEQLQTIHLPTQPVSQWVGLAEGSSYNALLMANPFIQRFTGYPMTLLKPDDVRIHLETVTTLSDHPHPLLSNAYFLVVSQSGETGSLLKVLPLLAQYLKLHSVDHVPWLCVTNNEQSSLAMQSNNAVTLAAMPEQSIAATKSVTTSLMALLLFGLSVGTYLPHGVTGQHWLNDDQHKAYMQELRLVPDALEAWLNDTMYQAQLETLARHVAGSSQFVLLSQGLPALVLSEASLKLTETSSNWVLTDTMESFKHGRTVILQGNSPEQLPNCMYLGPSDISLMGIERFFDTVAKHHLSPHRQRITQGTITFIRFDNSPVIPTELLAQLGLDDQAVITLPKVDSPIVCTFLLVVFFQVLSAQLATIRGVNPNHPALQKAIV